MGRAIAECWTPVSAFFDPRPQRLLDHATAYEAEGWDGTTVSDTQCIAPNAFVILTMIALGTTRLKMSTGVTVPLTRHPAVTASAMAALQEISGGRATVSIGRGDTALAYLGLAPTRLATLEIFVSQVRRYLAGESLPLGEVAPRAEGAVHGFDGLAVGHAPEGSSLVWLNRDMPTVPVEVAATGPKTLAMAGRTADRVALMVGADQARVRWAIQTVSDAAEQAGRDPKSIGFTLYASVVPCDGDGTRELELILPFVMAGSRFAVMDREVRGQVSDHDRDVLERMMDSYDISKHAQAGQGRGPVDDEYLRSYAIVGRPGYCLDRLAGLAELGVDRFIMTYSTADQPEYHEVRQRLVREILPTMQGH